ncbi:hypothetical protein EJB05_08413, partial [Eragrostis curvula]
MASSVTVRRTFEVPGYSTTNGVLYVVPFITRSAVFDAGGYEWSIFFNPDANGDGHMISIHLQLETRGATVTAQVGFGLLDPSGSQPVWKLKETTPPTELTSDDVFKPQTGWTVSRSDINAAPGSGFLTRGGLLFECTVTVFFTHDAPPPAASTAATASATQPNNKAALPPSDDLMEQLRLLHATEDGADVTYSVDGKEFRAHKIILALRSPVFKAELYRWAKEDDKGPQRIEVKEIKASAFKALLHYIYTDTLLIPSEVDDDDEDDHEMMMVQDLLVAADRYGVERMRLMCEDKLCKMLDVENVANVLAFADDHHFVTLKDACIEFMMTSDRLARVKAT